ncbi:MAG: hypothetical protein AAF696_04455 [Bacteroidota bacterium]
MQQIKHFTKFLPFLLGISLLFCSCEEEMLELSPEQISILNYGDSIQLSANLDVDWILSDSTAGSISAEGLFRAGNTSGSYLLEAVNKANPDDRIERKIFVSNRADDLNPLLDGGHIIYLRHAIARTGSDLFDRGPEGWHLSCSSDTARQLSPEGFTQAQDLGASFRNLEIPLEDTVYVSEYCRCIQTVEELEMDIPFITSKDITFFVYGEQSRHTKTLAFINSFSPAEKNVLLVSHSFGPGNTYPQPQQGYAAIFRKGPGEPEFVALIRDDEFILLK